MILHCSKKLAAKLADVSSTPLAEASPLGSWHGHLYSLDRRKCVMFCHDAKAQEFNPRYAEAALPGQFHHLHADIYGNRARSLSKKYIS